MRLLRFLRLPALLGLLRPLISFVSFSYSLTSSAALLDGGLWGGYEEFGMLGDISRVDHIYLACGYTDLRRGIDGLAQIVQQQFELDP